MELWSKSQGRPWAHICATLTCYLFIGTGLRLKTNMPPDVLDSRVKLCIELGDHYTTLRDEAMSYTWFVGAKALKVIDTEIQRKEVFCIPTIQSVASDPNTITQERIGELLSNLDNSFLKRFNKHGSTSVNSLFPHWTSRGGGGLDDITLHEARVYNFHALLDRGAADRWLGAMQYSVTQQALRLDLCAYSIAIALWNNGEWRLIPFPTPARFITEQMRLERLRNGMKKHKARAPLVSPLLHHSQNRTLLGPDDIPDFDIPETMEEWEDLVAREKLDKRTINTLPGDMFKSASQATPKQFTMLRIYAPKLRIEDNREAREDYGLPKWAFDKASNTFGNPQNGEIFLESSRQTRRSTVSGSNTMILMDGHR